MERAKRNRGAAERPQPKRPASQDHLAAMRHGHCFFAIPSPADRALEAAARVVDRRYTAYASDPRLAAAECAARLPHPPDPSSAFSEICKLPSVKGIRSAGRSLSQLPTELPRGPIGRIRSFATQATRNQYPT